MTVIEELIEGFKETEIGVLPEDWDVGRLGSIEENNVIDFQNGFPCGKWNNEGIGIPQLRPFNVTDQGGIDISTLKYIETDKNVAIYLLNQLDVIFNNTNSEELVGKTALWNKNGQFVLSNHMTRIRVLDEKRLHAYFLALLLHKKWFDGYYQSICRRHVNQASISLERLREIAIPLPPFPEQQKIASVLSAVQEAKEKTENVLSALKELKKSMMKHLFTYGAVSIEEAEKVQLKETEIGMIPEHWEVIELGNYCNFTTGKLNSNEAVPNGLYPFFTCSQETYKIDKYSFDCEAILLSGNNARGIYSVKYYMGKFNAYQRTYVITIKDSSSLDYKYLRYSIETKLENLREGSIGTSTKFLTLKMLLTLKICLPSLKEQQQMSATLSAIDEKIQGEEAKKNSLDTLFKTLLSLLMAGKVRVKNIEIPV